MGTAYGGHILPLYTDGSGHTALIHMEWTLANGILIAKPTTGSGNPEVSLTGSLPLLDSTTTALGASGTYTTTGTFGLAGYKSIVGSAYSDQDGTLLVEQSQDGTNWDVQSTVTVTGGSPSAGFDVDVVGTYGRLTYTNGATAQTTFRLYARGKTL